MTARWACSTCAVSVSFAPGHPLPDLPPGWTRHSDELRCLTCAREQVVAIALAEAGVDADAGKAATAIKRRALAEFELVRDADRPDAVIARVTGGGAATVAQVRTELLAAGTIRPRSGGPKRQTQPRPKPKPKPARPKPSRPRPAKRADVELRRDPSRSNPAIAKAAGVGLRTVARRRAALRAAGVIPDSGEGGS